MERKNGETFEFEGKKLKVVENNDNSGCEKCFFCNRECSSIRDVRGFCSEELRTDKKHVIFVEVKDEQPQQAEQPQKTEEIKERKVGEVFEYEGHKLKVVADIDGRKCPKCFFYSQDCSLIRDVTGYCLKEKRIDRKGVTFVEVKDEQPPEQAEKPRELNLCEILKDCPKGTKLYSPAFGEETYFVGISSCQEDVKPIIIRVAYEEGDIYCLSSNGHLYADNYGECCIFPSKEMRDWSKFSAPWLKKDKFDPKTMSPFDRVLARNHGSHIWTCDLFSDIIDGNECMYHCIGSYYRYCIPYNDDTKHLVGTKDEAPLFYRYWED